MAWFDKRKGSHRQAKLASTLEQGSPVQSEEDEEQWDEEEDDLPIGRTPLVAPRLSLQSRSLPAIQLRAAEPSASHQIEILTATHRAATAHSAMQNRRLAGRSTKVHLQAIRPEQLQEPTTEKVSIVETGTASRDLHLSASTSAGTQNTRRNEPLLRSGSGEIKQGQEKVTVADASISERSVVTVMLAGDPGPVVVQYILLHPQTGFTFHLSAAASSATPFNYSIWLC